MYDAMGYAHADALGALGVREVAEAEVQVGASPPDQAALRAGYREERSSHARSTSSSRVTGFTVTIPPASGAEVHA